MRGKIVFVQPFGLKSSGGGARILRSLVKGHEAEALSVCTESQKPPQTEGFHEVHLPFRPHMGRIETTRFAGWCGLLDWFFRARFATRLEKVTRQEGAKLLHVIPHAGLDFDAARLVCRKLQLPLAVSIHDHPSYCFLKQPGYQARVAAVGRVWNEAAVRFVISEEMGREMVRLFGSARWELASDGLDELSEWQPVSRPNRLHIYFMGLFHNSYRRNLEALMDASVLLKKEQPELDIRITLRCGPFLPPTRPELPPVEVLPFADEVSVAKDIEKADLLYLPLPFGDTYRDFVQYSLSTKLITYLGSSRPILYHGPITAAAAKLLCDRGAAYITNSIAPSDVKAVIRQALHPSGEMLKYTKRAIELAAERFNAGRIRERFWAGLTGTS